VQFSWDSRKANANLRKHRVAFAEAVTVFADPLALIVEDPVHLERARIIGESAKQRVLLVVFAEIVDQRVRIISARRATAHERKHYEEGD
jgi:uncharacterized DUF497 family protein